jgi:hypothetical protein
MSQSRYYAVIEGLLLALVEIWLILKASLLWLLGCKAMLRLLLRLLVLWLLLRRLLLCLLITILLLKHFSLYYAACPPHFKELKRLTIITLHSNNLANGFPFFFSRAVFLVFACADY